MTDLHACCLAGGRRSAVLQALKSNQYLTPEFASLIEEAGGKTAFMIKSGSNSNRAVMEDFFDDSKEIENITVRRNKNKAVDSVWLSPGQALVDLVNGGIMFFARGGEYVLAGRCTNQMPHLIRDEFRLKHVALEDVTVNCLFDIPRERRLSPFGRFRYECEQVGITHVESICELPPHGLFFHGGHENPSIAGPSALGICVRLT